MIDTLKQNVELIKEKRKKCDLYYFIIKSKIKFNGSVNFNNFVRIYNLESININNIKFHDFKKRINDLANQNEYYLSVLKTVSLKQDGMISVRETFLDPDIGIAINPITIFQDFLNIFCFLMKESIELQNGFTIEQGIEYDLIKDGVREPKHTDSIAY